MNNDKIGNIKDEFIHKYNLPYLQYKRLVELCDLVELKARAAGRREGLNEKVSENKRITQIFIELGEIHIVNNWTATKDGKGKPLLLKEIGAFKKVEKKYGVE